MAKATRKNYLELYLDGVPVVASTRSSNRHTSVQEASEHAEEHAREFCKQTPGPYEYEVRIDGGLYYVVKVTELILDHSIGPGTPPEAQAAFDLDASSYIGDEGTVISFGIDRSIRNDQTLTVDWAIINATVQPVSGTETFNPGDSAKTINVTASLINTSEIGTVELSNPQYVSGVLSNPVLGPQNQSTFRVTDLQAPASPTLFPLLATQRIGTFNYTQSGALAEDDRKAMGLMDAVLLGGFFGTPQDNSIPGADYISRAEVAQSILDYHIAAYGTNDIYMFTYLIQMTASDIPGANEWGDKCYAEDGPNGTDWFLRDANGNIVINSGESPGGGGMTLLHGTAIPDAQGRDFSEFYTDTKVLRDFLDVHAAAGMGVGIGGMNGWWDNLGYKIRKSGADPDQDGQNNDMGDYYDWDNPSHMSGVDQYGSPRADAVAFVGAYRASQRSGLERAVAAYPGLIIGGNSNQYNRGYSGSALTLPYVMREFRIDESDIDSDSYTQVGLSENNNWRPTELKSGYMRCHTLWTGISSDNGNQWQESYNNIAMPTLNMTAPAIQFGEWIVHCLQSSSDGPAGRPIWPNTPRSDSSWNAERWGHATNALCGAHHACSGVIDQTTSTTGERRATPLFDEYGLINGLLDYGFGSGGTKLYRKWMGQAIDAPQLTARDGMLWWREFDNCLVIINTNWDDTLPDQIVQVANLPGGINEWMRFNGVQDPAWNDGSYADVDFPIPSIDAIFLVRRSFYEGFQYVPTHYVAPFASVSGATDDEDTTNGTAFASATTAGNPCTLGEALLEATAGDIIRVSLGVYTTATDTNSRFTPAWRATNVGSSGSPIIFYAQYPAVHNVSNRTELRNGNSTDGDGSPTFGCTDGEDYIFWDGIFVNENVSSSTPDTGPVVLIGCTGSEVRRCLIQGDPGYLPVDNHPSFRVERAIGTRIRDCRAYDNDAGSNSANGACVETYDSYDLIIENNEFYDSGSGVFIKGQITAQVQHSIIIRNNHIHDCALGITIASTSATGGGTSGTFGSHVYQNLIDTVNSGIITRGYALGQPWDSVIANNLCINVSNINDNARGLYIKAGDYSNVVWRNNLIINVETAVDAGEENTTTGIDVDDNMYYNAVGNWGWYDGNNYASLAAWVAATPWDTNSVDDDPEFENEGAANYKLATGSPALNAGTDYLNLLGGGTGAAINYGPYILSDQSDEIGPRIAPDYS